MTPPPDSSNAGAPVSKSTRAITGALFAVTFPPTQSDDDSGGLPAGAIIGIVVGVAAGILALIALSILLCRRRKQSKQLKNLKSELGNSYFDRGEGTSEVPTTPMSMQGNDGQLGLHRNEVSLGAMSMGVGRAGVPRRYPSAAWKNQPHSSSPFSSPEIGELAVTPAAEERDDVFSAPSSGSSHPQELHGIHEVQLARPQRLSWGYARIVHTTNSTRSNRSVRSEHSEPRLAELP
jgi:hypothetical protein